MSDEKYYNYKQLCYVLTCVLIVSYKEQKSKRRITRTLLLFELSISVFRMQVLFFFLPPSTFSQARLQILFYFNEQWNSGEEVNVPYQACTHGESHRRARSQEVCWDEEDDKCFVIVSNSLFCSPGHWMKSIWGTRHCYIFPGVRLTSLLLIGLVSYHHMESDCELLEIFVSMRKYSRRQWHLNT